MYTHLLPALYSISRRRKFHLMTGPVLWEVESTPNGSGVRKPIMALTMTWAIVRLLFIMKFLKATLSLSSNVTTPPTPESVSRTTRWSESSLPMIGLLPILWVAERYSLIDGETHCSRRRILVSLRGLWEILSTNTASNTFTTIKICFHQSRFSYKYTTVLVVSVDFHPDRPSTHGPTWEECSLTSRSRWNRP